MARTLPAKTPDTRSQKFAARLKAVVETNGLNQVEIAKAVGRGQGYVSERLNGVRPVDVDMVSAIARMVNIPFPELMCELAQSDDGYTLAASDHDYDEEIEQRLN